MCGIVGMFGDEHPETLKRMLDATSHRGEDSTRFEFWDGRCGLGINRLSIMDLERGEQPLHGEHRAVHVVCNGEIYNHTAIVATDLRDRHTFTTRSDVEVIAHLLRRPRPRLRQLPRRHVRVSRLRSRAQDVFGSARSPGHQAVLLRPGRPSLVLSRPRRRASSRPGSIPRGSECCRLGFRLTPERGPEQYFFLASHKSMPNPGMVRELLEHAVEENA